MSTQSALLRTRRFLPFFITQALGAFNDNLFKQALALAILYKLSLAVDGNLLVNLCAGLFILPFFLFSALGGQFGEKFAKDALIRWIKAAEILIMLAGGLALWAGNLPALLLVLFLMGSQSALFGPVKYSILPQQLRSEELVGGNALVEMGTFVSILAGTLCAGVLMSSDAYVPRVAAAVLAVALLGYLASRQIPRAPAALPSLALDWHILRQTRDILRLGFSQSRAVSHALVGNAWFWFLGALYLTQIPALAQRQLHGDESSVTLILTLFSLGIAAGSLLCERLSGRHVEPALVPLGAAGLALFGLALAWHSHSFVAAAGEVNWLGLLAQPAAWWVLLDFFALGLFGGFYIVPLYALIQARSAVQQRARVIAANNILNALFMVASALFAIVLLGPLQLELGSLFLAAALLHVLINALLFRSEPEFLQRLARWSRPSSSG